ncbi:hypothetical protein IJG04_01375 [Candidatus Saccharibacteria bacterium]|nr:hypothetical protein [Candidatus Saccharibacteria bacterium]
MDNDFLKRLKTDYSDLRFRNGRKFAFRPPKTVILGPVEPFSELLALHEVSHAILGHKTFRMDVERLRMESEAWDKARELAIEYGIEINEDLIEDELDTYRDWLHQRSRCPKCGLTRFQTQDTKYHCPQCDSLGFVA